MSYQLKVRATPQEWDDVPHENPLAKAFQDAQERAQAVLRGREPVVYLCGGAGLGKTKTIEDALGALEITDYVRFSPHSQQDLWHAFEQAGNRPLILEECDNLFRSPNILNTLKLATDINGDRYEDRRVSRGRAKPAMTVRTHLRAPLLIALNGDLAKPTLWPGNCRRDIAALISREDPIRFFDYSREVVWEYSMYLALRRKMLKRVGGKDIPLRDQNAAIDWFTRHIWELDEVTPRRLQKITHLIAGASSTQRLSAFLTMRADPEAAVPASPSICRASSAHAAQHAPVASKPKQAVVLSKEQRVAEYLKMVSRAGGRIRRMNDSALRDEAKKAGLLMSDNVRIERMPTAAKITQMCETVRSSNLKVRLIEEAPLPPNLRAQGRRLGVSADAMRELAGEYFMIEFQSTSDLMMFTMRSP